ncbi:MAG: NAD(+) synthase [Pseudomonadota bacterium]
MTQHALTYDVLKLDEPAEIARIAERLRAVVSQTLKRRGLVVAISGGIDSSCSVSLAVRALGAERVLGLIMPERDSSDFSAQRANILANHLGIEVVTQNIATSLEAIGCYRWRDEAIRRAIPEYGPGWRMKIVIAGGLTGQINHFRLVAHSPAGEVVDVRLGLREYLQIVAATNFKQRIRKTLEYFHADRLNYGVVGTPNRLEYDQGFFVKNGDGAADVKPIAHLYKSQVYALARAMGLPESVCAAEPTTDTYSLPQGQDEFYFALPYAQMDLALWALNHDRSATELAAALQITPQQAAWVYDDIRAKRRTTRYLHLPPQLLFDVPELHN